MNIENDLKRAVHEFKIATAYFAIIIALTLAGIKFFSISFESVALQMFLIFIGSPFFASFYFFGIILIFIPLKFLKVRYGSPLFKILIKKMLIDVIASLLGMFPVMFLSFFLIIPTFLFLTGFAAVTKDISSVFFIIVYFMGYGFQFTKLIGLFLIVKIIKIFHGTYKPAYARFKNNQGDVFTILQVVGRYEPQYWFVFDGIQFSGSAHLENLYTEFIDMEGRLKIIKAEEQWEKQTFFDKILAYLFGADIFPKYSYVQLELEGKYIIELESDPFEYTIKSIGSKS